jgi:hypothetical protein
MSMAPFSEQELGTLESLPAGFTHGLLNDARAGKTDQRPVRQSPHRR